MMKRICDRCQIEIREPLTVEDERTVFEKMADRLSEVLVRRKNTKPVIYYEIIKNVRNGDNVALQNIDLCDDCRNEFDKFMNNYNPLSEKGGRS